jgi:hypothetical protein
MKNQRHITKNDSFDNRFDISNNHVEVPGSKLSAGSVKNKYPVVLDGGRTTIFISDESKESETRQRYELHMNSRFLQYSKKSRV